MRISDLSSDVCSSDLALSLDPDGGAITYSLLDDADGRFAIDPVTGVVTIADASRLDFDDTPSYTLVVVATNEAGRSASAPLTVNLLDVNEDRKSTRLNSSH